MSAIEQLFLRPREFLKMNLLVMLGGMPTTSGIHTFMFEDGADNELSATRKSKHRWKSSYDIAVREVHWRGGQGNVAAFWLPYQPNSRQRRILRDDVQFMFTANMTGCSFGAVYHKGLGLEVNHVNYQTEEGGIDEDRMAAEVSHCTNRLSQKRYREKARGKAITDTSRQSVMGATIIGVNDPTKGWKIYAQQWENTDGSHFIYHELIDV